MFTRPTAFLLVGLAIAPSPAGSQPADKPRDTLWKVSCTSGGRVVFVANVPASEVDRKAYEITSQKPGAACVFIGAVDPNAPPDVDGVTPVPFDGVPVETTEGSLSTGTPGLDTALRALRGDRVPVSAPPLAPPPPRDADRRAGEIYVAPPGDGMASLPPEPPPPPPQDPSTVRPKGADWVRLSLYSGADRMDAVADWRRILAQDPPLFASLTPLVVETDDYVMLAAGPVAPDERVDLCMSAVALGVDCVFGDEEKVDLAAASMDDFLAASGGQGNEAESRRKSPSELDAMSACGADGDSFEGRQCWRSPFALAQARRLSFDEPYHADVEARASEVPPASALPSARPDMPATNRRRKPRSTVAARVPARTTHADAGPPRT